MEQLHNSSIKTNYHFLDNNTRDPMFTITLEKGIFSYKRHEFHLNPSMCLFGIAGDKEPTQAQLLTCMMDRVIPPNRQALDTLLCTTGLTTHSWLELIKLNGGKVGFDSLVVEVEEVEGRCTQA